MAANAVWDAGLLLVCRAIGFACARRAGFHKDNGNNFPTSFSSLVFIYPKIGTGSAIPVQQHHYHRHLFIEVQFPLCEGLVTDAVGSSYVEQFCGFGQ
jgi:hypothetical protein